MGIKFVKREECVFAKGYWRNPASIYRALNLCTYIDTELDVNRVAFVWATIQTLTFQQAIIGRVKMSVVKVSKVSCVNFYEDLFKL